MAFESNKDIIRVKRDGSPTDPYVNIEQTIKVISGTVYLREIPREYDRVIVKEGLVTYSEVGNEDGILNPTHFYVDYREGMVYFHQDAEGKFLTFTYLGTGYYLIPATRVYYNEKGTDVIDILHDTIKEVDTAIASFVHKGEYSATITYYPRNIVNYNGAMYINTNQSLGVLPTDISGWQKWEVDVLQFKLEERTTDPISPEVGRIWLRTDLG